jgi:hypothetical protein
MLKTNVMARMIILRLSISSIKYRSVLPAAAADTETTAMATTPCSNSKHATIPSMKLPSSNLPFSPRKYQSKANRTIHIRFGLSLEGQGRVGPLLEYAWSGMRSQRCNIFDDEHMYQ